jgi:hypothetical protein
VTFEVATVEIPLEYDKENVPLKSSRRLGVKLILSVQLRLPESEKPVVPQVPPEVTEKGAAMVGVIDVALAEPPFVTVNVDTMESLRLMEPK